MCGCFAVQDAEEILNEIQICMSSILAAKQPHVITELITLVSKKSNGGLF